jgi:hypothetical protein
MDEATETQPVTAAIPVPAAQPEIIRCWRCQIACVDYAGDICHSCWEDCRRGYQDAGCTWQPWYGQR